MELLCVGLSNKFPQIRQPKPHKLRLYHILYILKILCICMLYYISYFNNYWLIIYKSVYMRSRL